MADIAPLPPPLYIEPSGSWFGNDGSWSTFTIHVGTPPQNFSVLPNTNGQNTWVPIADDCIAHNITNCGQLRGVLPFNNANSPGFQNNFSNTWELIGLFELGQNKQLGFTGNGLSGYDTVGFITDRVTAVAEIKHQAVTAFASSSIWLGQIGLSNRGMNFRQDERPESFLTNLKNSGMVPSLSFGYTAGASYRSTKVPGSLILGGYDGARMSEPLTVPTSEDDDRPLTIGVQSIVVTNSLNGSLTLSDVGFLAPIDSSISELWLPRSICDKIETAFGLLYQESTNRYILLDSTRDQLRQLSPVLTFTIGTDIVEGRSKTIQLTYSAFDLQASYPIFASTTNYFPIRRAANESQYVIGRVFLQETYIGVDYERKLFNVSQTVFTNPMPSPEIVAVPPLNLTSNSTSEPPSGATSSHHLSGGAIAGIVVGTIAMAILVVAAIWMFHSRKSNRHRNITKEESLPEVTSATSHPKEPELYSGETAEMDALHGQSEAEERTSPVVEIEGTPTIYELR